MGSEATKLDAGAQDFTAAFAAIQAEYTAAIAAASAKGDGAEIQRLAAEMTVKLQALHASKPQLKVVPPPPPKPRLYDQSLCKVNLDMTVYDGDRDTVQTFLDDEGFMANYNAIMATATPYNARKDLLKTALKLTPRLAPKVFEVLQRCRENIGLTGELEIFVTPNVELNAFCFPPQNGKYLIGVTSSLLEKFDDDELAFVLGHEIGHALFNHSRFPAKFLLSSDEQGAFSPLHAMRLYAWKRNAELSADRIGLIAARSFDAAARAFFKLSSGVTTNSLSFQLREYINQFTDLSEESNGEVDPEDWYSTHPFSPMRVKALDMFHRSETYLKLVGKEGNAELSEEQLELEVKKFMSTMEPSYLSESSDLAKIMRDFVFTAGYVVAQANGTVEESEVAALGTILDPKEVQEKIGELDGATPEVLWQKLEQLSEKLNVMLPAVSKLNVIKDLTVIAGADGTVDDQELEVLYKITANLYIRPEFVDHVLNSAGEETGEA